MITINANGLDHHKIEHHQVDGLKEPPIYCLQKTFATKDYGKIKKLKNGAKGMAWFIKALLAKTDNLSLFPGTHMADGERQLL